MQLPGVFSSISQEEDEQLQHEQHQRRVTRVVFFLLTGTDFPPHVLLQGLDAAVSCCFVEHE
jgi:hypothetical protein